MNYTSKKDISLYFRKARKLIKRVVNSRTNPLGIPEYADVEFYNFLKSIQEPAHQLFDYFNKLIDRETEIALIKYHRPVVRGRDGHLYSQADMDDAMMSC